MEVSHGRLIAAAGIGGGRRSRRRARGPPRGGARPPPRGRPPPTGGARPRPAGQRKRVAAQGVVRVEVQALRQDGDLIKAVAAVLRSGSGRADELRTTLERAVSDVSAKSLLEAFSSDLPDEAFDGVFDAPRDDRWRAVDL